MDDSPKGSTQDGSGFAAGQRSAPLLTSMASMTSMYLRSASRRLMVADTLRTSAAAFSRSLPTSTLREFD